MKYRAWDVFNGIYWYSDKYKNLAEFFTKMQVLMNGGNTLIFQQYTGFKDKNEMEIYNEDIVVSNHHVYDNGVPHKNVVVFIKGCWKLHNDYQNDIPLALYDKDELEVIGSNKTNPELLP